MSAERVNLSDAERAMLAEIALRPNGAMIRGEEEKQLALSLAAKVLVCDPHEMGNTLFTRITAAGLAALAGDRS